MKELLIAEMKRAVELLEKNEKPFSYWRGDSAELKHLLLQVRRHSILIEKDNQYKY
jgi:hypothetical protein